jgi:hypothetical protein
MRKERIIGFLPLALFVSIALLYSLPASHALVDPNFESPQPDTIRGRVVDAEGKPVPRAKLHVLRVGANPSGRRVYYPSDDEGNFSIKGLPAGVYDVFVSKEEDNYPDTELFFYSTKETSSVQAEVSEQQESPPITVRIGPKAGRITGRVVNAVTGAPIDNPTLTFRHSENKNIFLFTSLNQPDRKGGFDFLLPTVPLTIEVTAPGYAVWNYRNEGSTKQIDLLTLEPGKTKQLVVRMRPLK